MRTLIGLMASISVAWIFFMCEAMSMITANATGMFWYGLGLIVSGVAVRVLFDKV